MSKPRKFRFVEADWFTPNTYDTNFKAPPPRSGVYLLVNMKFDYPKRCMTHELLYVGSTKNLAMRYTHHEKLLVFRQIFDYVRFYFQETDDYYETEKRLIKETGARFNVQWR